MLIDDMLSTRRGPMVTPLPRQERCPSPSHYFPSMLSVPGGHYARHVCPHCGKVTVVVNLGGGL